MVSIILNSPRHSCIQTTGCLEIWSLEILFVIYWLGSSHADTFLLKNETHFFNLFNGFLEVLLWKWLPSVLLEERPMLLVSVGFHFDREFRYTGTARLTDYNLLYDQRNVFILIIELNTLDNLYRNNNFFILYKLECSFWFCK